MELTRAPSNLQHAAIVYLLCWQSDRDAVSITITEQKNFSKCIYPTIGVSLPPTHLGGGRFMKWQ
jgi:hypothetical protein